MIVTICGSMRFESAMRVLAHNISLEGKVVLMPHVNGKMFNLTVVEKAILDALHYEKILMSDAVVVVTDGERYIGDSTRREIEYAEAHGKPLAFFYVDTIVRNIRV